MKSQRLFCAAGLLLGVAALASTVLANPAGEVVRSGAATFDRSLPGRLIIHQGSDHAERGAAESERVPGARRRLADRKKSAERVNTVSDRDGAAHSRRSRRVIGAARLVVLRDRVCHLRSKLVVARHHQLARLLHRPG